MVKLALNGLKVWEDIGVIKFQITEHQRSWPIVQKFRALIKKRRIVLVGLNDKKIRLAQSCRTIKI